MSEVFYLKTRKTVSVLLIAVIVCSLACTASAAAVTTMSDVSEEMSTAAYWIAQAGADADALLMTADEIAAYNQLAVDASGTNVFDLETIREVTNADSTRQSLAKLDVPTRDLYVNGRKIDNKSYFSNLSRAISQTGYTDTEHRNQYAVCTSVADIKALPTKDVIGYSATDPDDEYQSSSLLVGEPFVIRQKCEVNGVIYYWGYANHVSGWVCSEQLALCADKEEWVQAWKVAVGAKDFIVVTQDQLTLQKSILSPETSERKLTMGTVLKLVPADRIPDAIGERNAWNNYVVCLPTRNSDGTYRSVIALIPQHEEVSVGYLPMTQANLLTVAFNSLGNRYGWGNMLDALDCSGYTRNVYRCFGLVMPRNTNWQQLVPGTKISLSGMSDAEKLACLSTLPAGSCLYFSGHTMILTGMSDGMAYAISATGVVSEAEGELNVQSPYSVIVSSLAVRRRNGSTWLANIDAAVIPFAQHSIANCTLKVARTADAAAVTVYDQKHQLREGADYRVIYGENTVCVIGCGEYIGAQRALIPTFRDVPSWSSAYSAVEWAVKKGIATGATADSFLPDRACTRAELVTMLYRAAGSPETTAETDFADVKATAYYAKAVAWAVENGITTGRDETHFAPGELCTRAELVTMLCRMQQGSADEAAVFTDVPADAYYAGAVAWAKEKGITTGVTAEEFAPAKPCTRAQLVIMLSRIAK